MSWEYFNLSEFDCKCGQCGGLNLMDSELIDNLDKLREECGFPFVISSGYRCNKHPAEVRKSAPGPHHSGLAVDILAHGESALMILHSAMQQDCWFGYGLNQKGDIESRFVHLDMCEDAPARPRPWIWTY